MTPDQKEVRRLTKSLQEMVDDVERFITAMDALMASPVPESQRVERGRQMAQLLSRLGFAKDTQAHFGLGLPLKPARTDR